MAEWEEIKRLAADFQRTQASDTLQRLSERNCIDLVNMLTERKMIDLIYSRDGREFITPSQLRKEIEDEVYINGGRMAINELANVLNVDYNHVEHSAKELAAELPEYQLILGQIIHHSYKATIGRQIQDTMMITGQLSIAEISKSLDLPSEFLSSIVKELLSSTEAMSLDDNTYYTVETMDRYKSIVAGTLSAILKPTSIVSIMKRLAIPEKIFSPIVDGLFKDGRIDATIENRIFMPAIYTREQNEWIGKFYASNSFISYDVLARMDVKQPKAYLRKRFQEGLPLKTCFVSPDLLSQVESLIEDAIVSNSLIDISSILPTSIEPDDIEMLVQEIFKKNEQFPSSCLVLNQVNICSHGFMATCKQSFQESMQTKAQEQLKNGNLVNFFLGTKLKEKPSRHSDLAKKQEVANESSEFDQSAAASATAASQVVATATTSGDNNKNQSSIMVEDKDQENDPQASGKKRGNNKKDKRDKKKDEILDIESDEEQGGKKGRSRKSGGGTQGREIKQKSTKKKYLVGKGANKQQANNDSDDEQTVASKAPRSGKGRAARRGHSPPERISASNQSSARKSQGFGNDSISSSTPKKEPLVFLRADEIAERLRNQSRGSIDGSDELFESIADLIEDDLNTSYGELAKQTVDDYLQTLAEEPEGEQQQQEEVDQKEIADEGQHESE